MSIAEAFDPSIPEWSLGDRLRKAREHKGLSREQMAEQLGVKKNTLWNWETDASRPRSGELVNVVSRWAEVTGVRVEWLLGLVGSRTCFTDQRPALQLVGATADI